MTIAFKLHYNTKWGQRIAVVGNTAVLGDDDAMQALFLDYQGGGFWGKEISDEGLPAKLSYKYVLVEEEAGFRQAEWGDPHEVDLGDAPRGGNLLLKDSWRARQNPENPLYTSAFKDVILRHKPFPRRKAKKPGGHPRITFHIDAPHVAGGYRLAISGNIEELGSWDLEKPLLLGSKTPPDWSGTIDLRSGLTIEYKYGLADAKTGHILALETGDNRVFPTRWLGRETPTEIIVNDTYFRHPGGLWRGSGVALPVFALRSKRGFGVGEFPDIRELVDWAGKVGMNMVQILPINDTSATGTWTDSYPYAAISVFALHPLYLNLDALPGNPGKEIKQAYEIKRKELNELPEVDYEVVLSFKLHYLRGIYEKQEDKFLQSASFRKFMEENGHWLESYGAFCHLRDTYGTVDFTQWEGHSVYSHELLESIADPGSATYHSVGFYYFMQFHLDKQLAEAATYARQKGIILKGDIPIGIYRNSVDAWVAPELYNMEGQSGAPPDPFSETGQNWGFPTYNWGKMAVNDYQWWQQRLQQLSRYFDTFRIDHILGFFRIWEIPLNQVQGLMGHFNPALPVRMDEFEELGIPFDKARYCQPYIVWETLQDNFGDESHTVRTTFLDEPEFGRFYLKPEFDDQRKIEAWFAREEHAYLRHLQEGLYALVAEVLFFEVPGSEGVGFHPRIQLQKTRSFKELPFGIQKKLDELYVNYFYRRQESFWRQQAMTKLPAIKAATNMLICGEDLGMVPDCVPGVMAELGILSLEIQRMSKNPKTEFLTLADIPYLSVCSPSTHDMSPIRLWWEEMAQDERDRFFHEQLDFVGATPRKCEAVVAKKILEQHLSWPCMWAVFPMQDILAMDEGLRRENPHEERINVPANPRHYWRYRLHLSLKDLLSEDAFNHQLRQMIQASGRSPSQAAEP